MTDRIVDKWLSAEGRFGKPDLETRVELEREGHLAQQGLHSSPSEPNPHWTTVDASDFRRKTGHLMQDGSLERF